MKIRKNHLYFGIIAAVALVAVFFYYNSPKESQTTEKNTIKEEYENPWQVDTNGYLSYPLDRENVMFNRQNYGETDNLTISKIIYQRGVGETDGTLPKIEEDYLNFLKGQEPYQHLMVYDALRAYDLLHSAPFVDTERIIIAGESLVGRIAIIAAAIDRNIKGVLIISSSGFDFEETNDTKVNTFLQSIDSDHYIAQITPRKLVMMHNYNDAIIPLSSAIMTYQKAQQPKQFVLVNDTSCSHGYCDSMYGGLVDSLDYLVGIRSNTLVSVPVR